MELLRIGTEQGFLLSEGSVIVNGLQTELSNYQKASDEFESVRKHGSSLSHYQS